jgi:hypothetical protein
MCVPFFSNDITYGVLRYEGPHKEDILNQILKGP